MSDAREQEIEEFEAWRSHPITKRVMQALEAKAAEAKASWIAASWDGGNCDERMRADLHATAETCTYIIELDFQEMEDMLAEPERD